MTARRILLWGLPFLLVGSLIFWVIMPPVIQNREQAIQAMRLRGWTVSLQDFQDWGHFGDGQRYGDIIFDKNGQLWIAGGGSGLRGVHVFDGTQWISYEGFYADLAVGPQGEIWAVGDDALDVYDGHQWKSYPFNDLGVGDSKIYQIEVDSRGRIWIIIGWDQIAELVRLDGRLTARFSYPQLTDTLFETLDADNQGRIWAAVGKILGEVGAEAGLYVFDGETRQRVPDQGMNLQDVTHTAFDNQGRVWAATDCSDVIMYDGKDWESIVQGDPNSWDPFFGIFLDSRGRVWAWNDRQVQLLEEGGWITLNGDNSAIPH